MNLWGVIYMIYSHVVRGANSLQLFTCRWICAGMNVIELSFHKIAFLFVWGQAKVSQGKCRYGNSGDVVLPHVPQYCSLLCLYLL